MSSSSSFSEKSAEHPDDFKDAALTAPNSHVAEVERSSSSGATSPERHADDRDVVTLKTWVVAVVSVLPTIGLYTEKANIGTCR